jgi:hypothetical protein
MFSANDRRDLEVNVTLVLPALGNRSHDCQHGQCYKLQACLTLQAPRQFFPRTQSVQFLPSNYLGFSMDKSCITCIYSRLNKSPKMYLGN